MASGRSGTMHWGWNPDGGPIWIRRYPDGVPPEARTTLVDAAESLGRCGVVLPVVEEVRTDEVVLSRLPWSRRPPRPNDVHEFVNAALLDALHRGLVVFAGEPHVGATGDLIVEEIAGVARIEAVDRQAVGAVLGGLAQCDAGALMAILADLTGGLDDDGAWLAKRSAVGLQVEWTPMAFVLALRDLAHTCERTGGSTARALWLVTDELMHRMSFAYDPRVGRQPLACRADLADLLAIR